MIISEVTMSYPCIRYDVEVSHFTSRVSTAIEWVILEAIHRCETLHGYKDVFVSELFEQLFAISDADKLILPCLLNLKDMDAIRVEGINDDTKLSTVPMRDLQLSKDGREMQKKGLLPGTAAEDTFTIYYDLITKTLRRESLLYNENASGIKVMDTDELENAVFPGAAIREWLVSVQGDSRRNRINWLSPTTEIKDITPLNSTVLWKNTVKSIDLAYGMQWRVVGEENEEFHELSLIGTDLPCPEEMRDIPKLGITDPDNEIEQFIHVSEVNDFIGRYQSKDDLFCVDEKYYMELRANDLNKRKKIRVGFIFGAASFEVSGKGKQLLIRIPDRLGSNMLYRNADIVVQAGIITVFAGSTSKDMAIAYVPKETMLDLAEELLHYVDKYYEQENSILFVLVEMGRKDLFLEYAERLVQKESSIGKKAGIIDTLNTKSISLYNKKLIALSDMEQLAVDEEYIRERCKSIGDGISIIEELSAVNSLRQNELIVRKVIRIILDTIGEADDLNDIWSLWGSIRKIKRTHIDSLNTSGLYRGVYSSSSVIKLLGQFGSDELFDVMEYTPVEQTVLNMKRICIQIQELLPGFDMYSAAGDERCSEVVFDMENPEGLYEQIRQWNDEEERFGNRITDIESITPPGSAFANARTNIKNLRNALVQSFDDLFMKYDKVYIVDTCTLMHEPELISWFDGENALFVIPMIVLNELDGKKSSDNEEEAFAARDVIRNINNYRAYEWLKTGETSYPELLSKYDLDKEHNDYKILSIALHYRAKQPTILTDDINFRNIAEACSIKSMDLSAYKDMKAHEKISKNEKKNKKRKNRK